MRALVVLLPLGSANIRESPTMLRVLRWSAVLAFFSIAAGCSSGGDDDNEGDGPGPGSSGGTCEVLADKLKSCELASESATTTGCVDALLSECEVACVSGADCRALDTYLCNDIASQDLSDCFAACEPPSYECGDGSGTYSYFDICDDIADCDNAADEVDCYFACDDGSTISSDFRCDGFSDCPNNDDEPEDCLFIQCVDPPVPEHPYESCEPFIAAFDACGLVGEGIQYCSPQITPCLADCYEQASCEEITEAHCGTGVTVELDACLASCRQTFSCDGLPGLAGEDVCDGIAHCTDGTDEPEDCDSFECADGGIVPIQYWCDGVFADCMDASDEEGCAPITCPE
jgi:hypothetical protein